MKFGFTMHGCDSERVPKVQQPQQIENKKDFIATLYNEMPQLMFQVVKRWTKGTPLIQADEIQSIPEGLHCCILVDSKNWAFRAIQNKRTVISDEELADFLNLAGCNTYAYFRTPIPNQTYYMRVAASAPLKGQIDTDFAFGY